MENRPKIGAFVLETLTTGMYTNPLDALREYIQNSLDSIRKAERNGVLGENQGRIVVELSPEERRLTITDNGFGLKSDEVYDKLISIGMSSKNIEENAGFRGIGRLAGIAYCDELTFRSRAYGEDKCSLVTVNCKKIRELISPSKKEVEELPELMHNCTKIQQGIKCDEDHFFEVCMENISPDIDIFLKVKELESYLQHVAPVRYDSQIFIMSTRIKNWVKTEGINIPVVTIQITDHKITREVFKQYRNKGNKIKTKGYDFKIKDIVFFPDHDATNDKFWGWYAETDLLGTIDDNYFPGFRIRKDNIEIGDSELSSELFNEAGSESRFNKYFLGEIHILNPKVIPNARRDGFENSKDWLEIKKKLMLFFKERGKEARATSTDRNAPTKKVIVASTKILDDANSAMKVGIASVSEKKELIHKLDTQIVKTNEALLGKAEERDVQKIEPMLIRLKETKEKLENENNYVPTKLRTDLDRKQKKIIQDILEILCETLDNESFNKAREAIMKEFGNK